MKVYDKLNMTMLCDFYELTMGQGYFEKGYQDRITYFDVFFRQCPDGGGFAIAAGLEQIIQYVQELHVDTEDIEYLRSRNMFSEGFLNYLANFKFSGDIWAVPEGTPVFPREPIITVRAPAIEAQLVETFLLLCINHQSLIATKANRVVRAAEGRTVLEFGSRRHRAPMPPFWAPGPPTSAAATEPPAPSPINCLVFMPAAPWRTPGYRCLTRSWTRSKPIAKCTPIMPFCWWTPIIP